MNDGSINLKAKSVIRRGRIIAGLLLFGSLAGILGGAAAVNRLSAADFFARFSSPRAILALGLFYLIYLPASLRIYYILLLNATGVFTASGAALLPGRQAEMGKVSLQICPSGRHFGSIAGGYGLG